MLYQNQNKTFDIRSFLTSTILHSVLIGGLAVLTFAPKRQEEQISAITAMASDAPAGIDETDLLQLQETTPEAEAPKENFEASMMAASDQAMSATMAVDSALASSALPGSGKDSGDQGKETGLKSTLFGSVEPTSKKSAGVPGLVGRLIDFKQDRARKKLPYTGNATDYRNTITPILASGFAAASTKSYFQASTQLVLSQLMIPMSTSANDAPKAFNVEKEVEPRGWMVHYTGIVTPPTNGQWRFVGMFDDVMIVFVNNHVVLDASWAGHTYSDLSPAKYDETVQQNFGGPDIRTGRKVYAGKWFNATGTIKLDVMIGETPGGLVGGMLMCEKKGVNYKRRPDGSPIIPLFATSLVGYERIRNDAFAKSYQFMEPPPIWKVLPRK